MEETLNDKFDQILKLEAGTERFESENQVTPYLRIVTGYRYNLEISQHRILEGDTSQETGKFFQIIPDRVDNGFFDWYCDNFPGKQLFQTVEMALLHFVFYWHVWKKESETTK
jgi:hypothetical protein